MDIATAATLLVESLALPIPGDWIVQGGAVGLLGVVALMVFIGRLVPRSTYNDIVRDRDQWRDVALRAMGHTDALMPAAQITTKVTEALGLAAEIERALTGRDESGTT